MGNFSVKPVKDHISSGELKIIETSVTEVLEKDIIIKCPLEKMIKAFFKDYVILWHDPNLNSEENQGYRAQLEEFGKVLAITEWEKARDYIQSAKTVCHVITSETNGELLVKEIFEVEKVCSIYVFCGNKEYHSTWTKKYQKIKGVETRIETVLNRIQQILKGEDSLKMNLPAFSPIFNDWDKSGMNHLHLYLKVIPHFKNRQQAKNDFVSLARRIYSQKGDMNDIADFERRYNEYNKGQILQWYTRDSFLFKVLNNCLRIATSDSIQYCRLLLKDIERAIKEQYQTKSKDFNGLLFRGAYMSEGEWSSLKENIGREIEMHGFLSVSKEKKKALNFVKYNPSQKIFITILVPKGPNEEEQGFAEIEEFSWFPGEKEILFNVRSRFTILEAEDEYSKELPYRHLVLLYGARGFRRFIAEQNSVHQVSIKNIESSSCTRCKVNEELLFVPLAAASLQNDIYYCKKCIDYDAAPFLCVPAFMGKAEKAFETSVKGCLLMNAHLRQTPFYGYKCCHCQAKKQKGYFICADCCGKENKWCESCFDKTFPCRESGHRIVLETSPFSFWCERMSSNELNHLKFHNDLVKQNSHLFELGEMYFESHEYENAIEYYSLYIHENEGSSKNAYLALSYHNLGSVYDSQGEYQKALEYHLKSLDITKSVYGDNHPHTATSYNNIGGVYDSQGEYQKALEYYLKSLDIRKSVYGDNHPHTATFYNNIGSVYYSQGKYQKALEYHLKSLDITKSIYGYNHPGTATSYHNIGRVYDKQGEYQKALEYHLKSLDIKKSVYGDNHPSTATSYNNIGSVYYSQEEYQKALEYNLKSRDITKSIYGYNHPDTATSYNNIGSVYYNQGEYQKALEYHLKSLDIYKSVYGDNHPDTATSYNNIGSVYGSQGEYQKALEYNLKSLDIRKSVYGDNHPHTATSYNNIGSVYYSQGEYQKALEYHLKSLDITKCVYGDNHPSIAAPYNNIGSVYYSQGKYQKALEYYLKSIDIRKSVYGDDHSRSKSILKRISEIESIDQSKQEQ